MEVMNRSAKRKYAAVCFLPLIAYLFTTIYFIAGVVPGIPEQHVRDHVGIMTLLDERGTLIMPVIFMTFIITLSSFLYCIKHIIRLTYMNSATKIIWVVLLIGFAPFSFLIFYFTKIRHEHVWLRTYVNPI